MSFYTIMMVSPKFVIYSTFDVHVPWDGGVSSFRSIYKKARGRTRIGKESLSGPV